MNENEIFYPVKGYEDYLEINKNGEIYKKTIRLKTKKSFIRQKRRKLKFRSDHRFTNYYPYIDVRIKDKKKRFLVHVLLAKTFIPNPNNRPEINHKDGNKQNFSLINLEWITHQDNMRHAAATDLMRKGDNFSQTKMTTAVTSKAIQLLQQGMSYKEVAQIIEVHTDTLRHKIRRKDLKEAII